MAKKLNIDSFKAKIGKMSDKQLNSKCQHLASQICSVNTDETQKVKCREQISLVRREMTDRRNKRLDKERAMWKDYWNSFTD